MKTPSAVINKLNAALFTGALAIGFAVPAQATVVYVNRTASPITVTNSIDGIYINVVTDVTGASAAAVPGWDLNPYNNGAGLTFYGAASPSGVLATGTPGLTAVASALVFGTVISATPTAGSFYNQFQTTGAPFQIIGQEYLGFRFLNEATATINYGWMLFSTTAGTGTNVGFPASILGYAYENAGLSITAGQTMTAVAGAVPEPSTYALFGIGLAGAAGLNAWKRRRQS